MALSQTITHGDYSTPILEYGWTIDEPEAAFHVARFKLICDDYSLLPKKHDDVSSYFSGSIEAGCKFYVVSRSAIREEFEEYSAEYIAHGATDTSLEAFQISSEINEITLSKEVEIGGTTQRETITAKLIIPTLEYHHFTTTLPDGLGTVFADPPIAMNPPEVPSSIEVVSSEYRIVDQKIRTAGVALVEDDLVPAIYSVTDYISYVASYQAYEPPP